MTAKKSDSEGALHITDQHRWKDAMIYDLRCKDVRLTLSVTPRTAPTDESEWRIDAQSGRAADTVVVTAWGPTRVEALRRLGESWTSSEANGLPHFDWSAIEKALTAVRAL